MKYSELVQKIGIGLSLVFVFLFPLWFLPITSDFYEFNKQILLIGTSLVLLLVLSLHWVMEKQVKILRTPLGLPVLALAVSVLLSTVLRSPNKIEALIDPAQTGTILAGLVLFFAVSNLFKTKQEISLLVTTFFASSLAISTLGLLWGSGIILKILPESMNFTKSVIWSPTGASLNSIVYLVVSLVMAAVILIRNKWTGTASVLPAAVVSVNLVTIVLTGYLIFAPQSAYKPTFLPQSTGWAIALEVLKSSPILGSGPASFLSDFTQFRPIIFNLTPNWAVRFTSSSNQYLQMLTVTGFLGFVAYLYWLVRQVQMFVKSFASKEFLPLAVGSAMIALMFVQIWLPLTTVTFGLMFILTAMLVLAHRQAGLSTVHESTLDIVATTSTGHSPIFPWAILLLVLLVFVPSVYLVSRAYGAEILFQKSLVAASANDGKKTYDTLIATVQMNPYRDTYRVAYSQTNMLIANTLASNKDISDADRNTVTQLVQQAIREAKNAVALNPTKVTNVENLASIYRNLLNFAQGADAWTTASYQQAVALDPINPNLRIALGGVYFAQKNFDEAVRLFQTAVDLKPDLANAHYNLAAALREKGQYEKALASLDQVLQLISDKNSEDYTKASEEADELRKKVTSKEEAKKTNTPSQLTSPESALPKPKIVPPIKVSEALAPEAPSTPSAQ
ncbi:MAG: tetratricopeptide repeat protein [Candidatus Amesbacteria bacterium]|nr:tetratricopeptide repeat protein [Candidatus Amesbacteria bacterium]